MIRRTGLVPRSQHHRDAKLYIVATEGEETEPRYFHAIQERDLIPRSRVKIHVLPAEDGCSAVAHIVSRIEGFLAQYAFVPDLDEVWLVLDTDLRVGDRTRQLAELLTLSRQKGWNLAISHPCFEVWLLLHVTDDLRDITDTCSSVVTVLRRHLGEYAKAKTPDECLDGVRLALAIDRAQRVVGPGDWPTAPGTQVHRLLSALRRGMPS